MYQVHLGADGHLVGRSKLSTESLGH